MTAAPALASRPGLELPALAGFARATEDMLERSSLLKRTDTKFIVPARVLDPLLERMSGHYAVLWAGDLQVAEYRTLYFDTDELRCFHDHRRGRRARHKVRIRHYPDRQCTYLEIKTKSVDEVTHKHRRRRPYGDSTLDTEGRQFAEKHTGLPGSALDAQVWTNFRRVTLIGLEIDERVTIDIDLDLHVATAPDAPVSLGNLAIVEVKQSPFSARTPAMLALRAAGLRPGSASKYCAGIAFTRPGLRVNRLLPTLRAMERYA